MKKNILFLILATLFITVNSCKKDDPATSPASSNQGNNGSNDPCKNIVCINDGYCVNGECICPLGFTGPDCSQQVDPKIYIEKITVMRFPATTGSGGGWDVSNGADIYPQLLLGTTIIWESPNQYENADPNKSYSFTPSPVIYLPDIKAKYTIRLFDYDWPSADDYIGGFHFETYHSSNKFPTELTIDIGSDLAFKLQLKYKW